ncbi:hypothetical protein HUT19_29885 [Streptomyces sp. NA02950]|uniref:hypothetical protein n=1 Tax=Streptomyces sp. NA02950 TaxID=2742137 RepID=UPI001590D7F4|nr:hypothetical protein [Streptomyces sp. NA02950]QKV97906.1 hypothetical protein HUT19_29885 [Streptomyces sp. NA02950]
MCLPLVWVLPVAALTGCGPVTGSDDAVGRDGRAVQRLLDRRAEAVRERDAHAFLATVDRGSRRYRDEQRRVFGQLAAVPLRSWTYRLVRTGGFQPALGSGRRLAAQVELRYRLDGYDTAPVVSAQYLTLAQRGGRWYVASDDGVVDGKRSGEQLWDQGRVEVVRGAHSLVLGVGQRRRLLRAVADTADRAVPALSRVWPGAWAGRVVVEVPADLDRMAALLGAAPNGYRGIAAVTTGEIGGNDSSPSPADRVIVNPEAYQVLGDFGRQVVITHETAHVATRSATTAATPLWLSEGFADWVGYRTPGRTPSQVAPELADSVATGQLPRALPRDGDFRFGSEPDRLSRAYEQGWLACRLIADRWGGRKLVEFYREVGQASRRSGAVESALRRVLDVSLKEFTAMWRAYVAKELA